VPTIATLAATAVAAIASCAAALWAYRRWRGPHPEGASDGMLVDRRPLAFVGLVMSLLALVTVLLVGLPALVLGAC
jgi:hypothetical protein